MELYYQFCAVLMPEFDYQYAAACDDDWDDEGHPTHPLPCWPCAMQVPIGKPSYYARDDCPLCHGGGVIRIRRDERASRPLAVVA